jgi:hypothetical protein
MFGSVRSSDKVIYKTTQGMPWGRESLRKVATRLERLQMQEAAGNPLSMANSSRHNRVEVKRTTTFMAVLREAHQANNNEDRHKGRREGEASEGVRGDEKF